MCTGETVGERALTGYGQYTVQSYTASAALTCVESVHRPPETDGMQLVKLQASVHQSGGPAAGGGPGAAAAAVIEPRYSQ